MAAQSSHVLKLSSTIIYYYIIWKLNKIAYPHVSGYSALIMPSVNMIENSNKFVWNLAYIHIIDFCFSFLDDTFLFSR